MAVQSLYTHTLGAPPDWDPLLRKLRVEFPDVVLAGGAVRDTLLGKPIKDLNLFVGPTLYDARQLEKLGFEPNDYNQQSLPAYGEDRIVTHVVQFDWQKYRCELIGSNVRRSIPELIRTFDIGICQIAYMPDRTAIYTANYKMDRINKVLRAVNASTPKATLDRLRRIGEKYEGWSIDASLIAPFVGGDDALFPEAIVDGLRA